ncbi:hypothetical protein SAMN02745172_02501 [Pseudoxanthobacter soli DSM 19599]|uniref:Helix-turn-helix domain-containing protein n=1 Tax=Pseudoxanthobacter soli DSM 19599 TaxID=1123029 RepID=A0A1M7ZLT0_9HYPH|nr:helix-turn-helix domain-containing protein [Pseudoxanthobacter soli]SHO65854.1 hypothetical protein SAMN02745172_02501 [Pseudoxanthobacter soli DSM 19599]
MTDAAVITPRALTREQVASYLGLSPSAVSDWQARGLIPGPIPGTRRWDRVAIDRAMDRISGLSNGDEAEDDFSAWRRANGH